MPILPPEPDRHPLDLFQDDGDELARAQPQWWLMYTKSRQEKQLMRHLRRLQITHYAPQVENRRRSPSGRIRTTYLPLFPNYVFVGGTEADRYESICTGCIQKATEITDIDMFLGDLGQIRDLIEMGVPLTVESRLQAGEHVRVKSGAFKGYEGVVVRREHETRLLVSVRFMEQGVSVRLDDCQLEPIGVREPSS